MAQQPEPRDLVIATGVSHSLKDFVRIAFESVGLDYSRYVVSDSQLFRPKEIARSMARPVAGGGRDRVAGENPFAGSHLPDAG